MSERIPQGTYRARAVDHAFDTSKNGKLNVIVTFQITAGDLTGEEIAWVGYLSPAARERTLDALRLCGWVGDDIENMGDLVAPVDIVVRHEEYDGKMQTRVAFVNAPGGRRLKPKNPPPSAELAAFAAEIKGQARESAARVGVVPTKTDAPPPPAAPRGGYSEATPPPAEDQDLPFASSSIYDEPHPTRCWRRGP